MKTTKKKQPPKSAGPSLFRDRVKGLVRLPADRIEVAAKNFRTHDDRQRAALDGVLSEVGIAGAAVAWVPDTKARAALAKVDGPEAFAAWLASFTGKVRLIDGHLRRERLAAQGQPVLVTDLDEREAAKALATFDAVSDLAGVDPKLLASLLEDVGTPEHEGTVDLLGELRKHIPAAPPDRAPPRASLADRFGVPPFSVLNAREGWWQARKAAWIAIGLASELGRGGGLTLGKSPQVTESGLNYYRNRTPAPAGARGQQ